ncbi:MAG TPA: uracil-DNA glycosylase [Rectinemataceae bacterium]|nr:uracil-DNA glycosylase [Rectinemataceae bacterium]
MGETDGPMSPREALATLADWLEGGEPRSGWGGPIRPRSESDFGDLAVPALARPASGEAASARAPRGSSAGSGPGLTVELEADRIEVDACHACRLGEGRRHAAYGEGVASPFVLVLVVGEGPGAEEDAQGRPFVGPAGQLLDKMLGSVGLSRTTNCYIANIVKCRPPGNREPAPDEREACLPWLERQIEALRPAFILAMGRTAATSLLGSADGIGKLRGRWFERRGIPLLATYHPSALLRDESLKRPAWEDLKMLKYRLGEAEPRDTPATAPDATGGADPASPSPSGSD